jgi:hypothetical protein
LKNIPPLPENAVKCSVLPLECPPILRTKKPKKKKVKFAPLAKLIIDKSTGIPKAPELPYKLPPLPPPTLHKYNTIVATPVVLKAPTLLKHKTEKV